MDSTQHKFIQALNNINSVSNLDINKDNFFKDDDVELTGSFMVGNKYYSFFYSESNPLISFNINIQFIYLPKEDELLTYKRLNNFNRKNLGIKASIINQPNEDLVIDFAYGFIGMQEICKGQDIDLNTPVILIDYAYEKLLTDYVV